MRSAATRGVVAGLAGVATVEFVTAALRAPSFLDAAGRLVVDTGPIPVVERTVQLLRTADKPVIRTAVAGTVMAAGGLLGRLPRRRGRDLVTLGAVAAVGAGLSRREGAPPTGGAPSRAAAGLAAGAGVLCAFGILAAPPTDLTPVTLGATTALVAALARRHEVIRRHDTEAAQRVLRPANPLPPASDGAESWVGVAPLLTPVEHFYVTDVAMRPPVVERACWRLTVTGAVANPLSLSYDKLIAMGLVEFDAVMVCIHNRVAWNRLGNARWTGVPLRTVLANARPDPSGAVLVTRAVDGWECSFALPLLEELEGYVVIGMGGKPLTAAHGFPARVFIPGLYGQYTGAKWLTELRVQHQPNRDYWLPRGWSRGPVRVRPLSRVDVPVTGSCVPAGDTKVAGVAWAPPSGVASVEIAVDDRPWTSAELAANLAPTAWRRWRATVPLGAGLHRIRVRCLAEDGTVQDPAPRPPFPSGASGHHTITVTAH